MEEDAAVIFVGDCVDASYVHHHHQTPQRVDRYIEALDMAESETVVVSDVGETASPLLSPLASSPSPLSTPQLSSSPLSSPQKMPVVFDGGSVFMKEELNFTAALGCPICCEVLLDPVATPCGHTFCKPCWSRHLNAWLNSSRNLCPVCFVECPRSLEVNKTLQNVVASMYGDRLPPRTTREDVLDWKMWRDKPLPTSRPFRLEFQSLKQNAYWSVGVTVRCATEGVKDRYIYVSSLKASLTDHLAVQYDPAQHTLSFTDIETNSAHIRTTPENVVLLLTVDFGWGAFCTIL
ncbi:protein ORF144 [Cyprinid herpesvirus 3]|uniref:ORF144L n=1 Tax=Cyprinid herpesvirus 3 TaxID=180230 RepID=A3QMV9_CYHV3|nr:unnamed protein product [Cyprinid herpesvirus 3]ABC55099.1 hypothetical protein [Cyprinid herpesvirus 3]ABG42971.1 protein ORF144 [Cyprinid herpesvirus 3]AIC32499.1 ORF144L [Cyprinid herpesvirus 3]AJP55631.1 protein ORF144 [Cyprinid herpesvirus 3]AJP55786.1 protein ORF144 [Cyprinid herpesvirus 3]